MIVRSMARQSVPMERPGIFAFSSHAPSSVPPVVASSRSSPAERHAHEHAAVNATEELIHRLKGADGVDEVDEDRVRRHGEE